MHAAKYKLQAETPDVVLDSVFKQYDKDKNQGLDLPEFRRALSDLGITDDHEQSVLFHLADHDNGGYIDIKEFIGLIKHHEFDSLLSDHDQMEFLWNTWQQFEQYDADGNGESSVTLSIFTVNLCPFTTFSALSRLGGVLALSESARLHFGAHLCSLALAGYLKGRHHHF